MYANYHAQFERAFALAARRPNTFFMDHHPVLAFAPNPSKPAVALSRATAALQSVLQTLEPVALFPPNVKALLSGHVHLFEVVSFSTPQPPQFVSGNGGDWVDTPLPLPLRAGPDAGARRRRRRHRRDQPLRIHDDGARRRALDDDGARRRRQRR